MKEYPIKQFAIGGYRSFGQQTQHFEYLSKVNLFIGRNNSGKSNILRFIHDVFPKFKSQSHLKSELELTPLDEHIPDKTPFVTGLSISLDSDRDGECVDYINKIVNKFPAEKRNTAESTHFKRVLSSKLELDGTRSAWFYFGKDGSLIDNGWKEAFSVLSDGQLASTWRVLTHQQGGSRDAHWFPETLRRLQPSFGNVRAVMVPAIRRVGDKGTSSEEFSGEGIIERLVRLQNPDVLSQDDRKKFHAINKFLQTVTDNHTAKIEVPHNRATIIVHMDGRALPLDSLGTGIHEVIILAVAATVLDNTVVCMEEPELHLNPILQKKLVRYLMESTSNQYFITTHSASLMDTPGAEIYHVQLEDGQSIVERVTSNKHRSEVCEDLGYHPSDLLQTNCIIWVEGPSDRIYLNHWISAHTPDLVEGIHYSIMFYGGKLLSHLTGNDADAMIDDFISLRRLNRRGVIIIDSDRSVKGERINPTKQRLKKEFDSGPGFAWITDGREIENYVPYEQLIEGISTVHPSVTPISKDGQYNSLLLVKRKGGKRSQASKVGVARYVVENYYATLDQLDLSKQLRKLCDFILESNEGFEHSGV